MIVVQIGTNMASWEVYDNGSAGPVKKDNGNIHCDSCLKFIKENKDEIEFIHLIEPVKDCFPYIEKSYNFFERKTIYNIAITNDKNQKELKIYLPNNDKTSGHVSSNPNHLSVHGHTDLEVRDVNCFTLNDFLTLNSIDRCDRLYIDTEGLDCLILLDYDYNKFKTNYIEFEIIHSDGPYNKSTNAEKCINRLINDGFTITNSTEDNLNLIAKR